ncbi:MAG: glucosidase, partial [Mycobacteriales bacterium]
EERGSDPFKPSRKLSPRNDHWHHMYNGDVISMPDKWEYPWYAAWDLAFHMVAIAEVDPDFAKEQLILLCREWFMHPNGQLPAYEWSFDDANPPVHAWAAHQVFLLDAQRTGVPDHAFLERVFHKLLINFTWWVNRKDFNGRNVFAGGFLGLDNIGLFDRSKPLPAGGMLDQADGTSWMAMYALDMLAIALELARQNPSYEDVASKFFEHFLQIARALNTLDLWDEQDHFFYDVLRLDGKDPQPLRVRSAVGLIPLFAVHVIDQEVLDALPDFARRFAWFLQHEPDLACGVSAAGGSGRVLSVLTPDRLRQVLAYVCDEQEFLSPHGIRSLSRTHLERPVTVTLAGEPHSVGYEPGESRSPLFGGNSNWRGPLWFPVNFLLVASLQQFSAALGPTFTVEHPTGSGTCVGLDQLATDLSRRLIGLFLPDADGRRPVNGGQRLLDSWPDVFTFNEYFHGDTGAGLGASHQTGWTALVAALIARQWQPVG